MPIPTLDEQSNRILDETIEKMEATLAKIKAIRAHREYGTIVAGGKIAYDLYGELLSGRNDLRFPGHYGFAQALSVFWIPYEEDCCARGVDPATGKPYDTTG